MKIGADKLQNLKHATELVVQAAKAGARLVSLPECFNCPYGTQYFGEYAEQIPEGETSKHLMNLAKDNNIFLIGGSIPEAYDNKLYNTSVVVNPSGDIIAKHRKVHLFDIDIPGKIRFQESDVLSPGNSATVFDVDGLKVGIGICYDVRFPELAHLMRLKGAQFMIYPGAFNMTTGPIYYELLTRSRAVDNQVYCASIAPARDPDATYVSWGHSVIVSPSGTVIDSAEDEEKVIYCDINKSEIQDIRTFIPTWNQKRGDIYNVSEVAGK